MPSVKYTAPRRLLSSMGHGSTRICLATTLRSFPPLLVQFTDGHDVNGRFFFFACSDTTVSDFFLFLQDLLGGICMVWLRTNTLSSVFLGWVHCMEPESRVTGDMFTARSG